MVALELSDGDDLFLDYLDVINSQGYEKAVQYGTVGSYLLLRMSQNLFVKELQQTTLFSILSRISFDLGTRPFVKYYAREDVSVKPMGHNDAVIPQFQILQPKASSR